jgi:hypothetical protein
MVCVNVHEVRSKLELDMRSEPFPSPTARPRSSRALQFTAEINPLNNFCGSRMGNRIIQVGVAESGAESRGLHKSFDLRTASGGRGAVRDSGWPPLGGAILQPIVCSPTSP